MKIKTLFGAGVIFLVSSILAYGALDLKFTTAITQTPDPINAGVNTTFIVSFRTVGGAVSNFNIIGGVDGSQIFTRTYANIGADITRTDSFKWTATAGDHTVWFVLDPEKTQGDSNYLNNRIEKAITVLGGGPAGQPNLKLDVSYSPADFKADDAVIFTLKAINDGTADSVACEMQLKSVNTVLQTFNIPSLASGGQINKTYVWTAVCNATLSAKVDSNHANTESNESDNEWTKQMTCGSAPAGLPDLALGVVVTPPKFKNGENVTFTVKIDNIGSATSPSAAYIILNGAVGLRPAATPSLEPGGHFEYSTKIQFLCDAEFQIIVDDQNKIPESNESNNKWTRKMSCGTFSVHDSLPNLLKQNLTTKIVTPSADAPDLRINFVKWNGKGEPMNGASMEAEVENIGLSKSNPCTLSSTTEGPWVDVFMAIPALDKGEKFTARYIQQFKCGGKMIVKVDSKNKNIETDEGNNTMTKTFLCLDLK